MARLDPTDSDEQGDLDGFSRQPLFAPDTVRPPAARIPPARSASEDDDREASPTQSSGPVRGAAGAPHPAAGATPHQAIDQAVREFARSVDRALAKSNEAIIDALKAAPIAQPQQSRRRARLLTPSIVALSACLGAAIAGGATYAAGRNAVPPGTAVDPNTRALADSWSYLWRASPSFRDCWTDHARTRQAQTCTVTIGGPAPAGRAAP